jgi:hypothetical protein
MTMATHFHCTLCSSGDDARAYIKLFSEPRERGNVEGDTCVFLYASLLLCVVGPVNATTGQDATGQDATTQRHNDGRRPNRHVRLSPEKRGK